MRRAASNIDMYISNEGDQKRHRCIREPYACRSAKELRHSHDLIDLGSERGLR